MRWDNLFDDLVGQLEGELAGEAGDLEAEEERLRLGRLGLRDRLVAVLAVVASARAIRVHLTTGDNLAVIPTLVGSNWFSADIVDHRGHCLVPLAGVVGLGLTATQIAASHSPVRPSLNARLDLSVVLRDLCRRRGAVELVLRDSTVRGTIDRVGRDHVDIAMHEAGSARRGSAVTDYRVVPIAALVLVRY